MNSQLLKSQNDYLGARLRSKTIMISGATGLIGSHVVEQIKRINDVAKSEIKTVALYRSEEKRAELEKKLEDVSRLLLTRELPYIATNPDLVCPVEFGSVPDCGSVCEMIYNATGKRPVVIGKPTALMPELAMKQYGYAKEETAVIGDRIYTDIKSGLNAGILGILVMSGETTEEILASSEDKPHLVLKDCSEMMPYI